MKYRIEIFRYERSFFKSNFSQKAGDSDITTEDLEKSILQHFDQIRDLKRKGNQRIEADDVESRDDNRSRYNRFTDRLRFVIDSKFKKLLIFFSDRLRAIIEDQYNQFNISEQ